VQPQCLGGVDLATGQDQFAGDGAAHQVVQRPVDHRPLRGLGMSEPRAVRGNAQVAQDGEIEPAAEGDPVNGRDHRHREAVHRMMEPVRRPPEPFGVARVVHGKFPQVEACAEAAAAPGDDQDFEGRIVREPGEDGDGSLAQRDGQRVLLLRAVVREDGDTIAVRSARQQQRAGTKVSHGPCLPLLVDTVYSR